METKFKKEIADINNEIISGSKENTSANLFDSENKNEIISPLNEGTNNNTSASGTSEIAETKNTQIENAKTNEGAENEIKKVETRGRKTLSDDEKKARAEQRETGKSGQTSLINDLGKYKTNVTPQTSSAVAASPEIDLSKYISGALLLIVIDSCFPALILMIAGFIDVKYKTVNQKLLKLSNDEKKELEPLADAIIKLMFGMVHPAIAFLVATGMMYAGKLMALEDSDFEKKIINPKMVNLNAKKK